jgi:hypothetical protein
MPRTFSRILLHTVFSTKHREPWIKLHAHGIEFDERHVFD